MMKIAARIRNIASKDNLLLLGITLSILGVPVGMYLSYFFPFVKWSWVVMFLSALLIVDINNLRKLFLPSKTRMLGIIVVFQIVQIFYGLCSDYDLLSSKFFIFHLYVVVLCIGYATRRMPANIDKLSMVVFAISLVGSVCGAYLASIGLIMGEEWFAIQQSGGDIVLEPITASDCAAINIVAGVFMDKKNIFLKVLFVIAVILGFYLFLVTNKRTFVLFVLFSFFAYYYKKVTLSLKAAYNLFFVFIIGVVAVKIATIYIPNLDDMVSHLSEHFYKGIQTLLGNTHAGDLTGSAIARVEQRNRAFREFEINSTLFSYIFGKGYFFAPIDAPLFQSYLEMGVIGFFFYLKINVLYPILNFIRIKSKKDIYLFPLVMSFEPFLQMFSAGVIQGYNVYTYACLMSFVLKRKNGR